MTIQFNTDNNITGSEALRAPLITLIKKKLWRFDDKMTRLEVHLRDEDSHKDGLNDKRCMLEARLEGIHPVAVTNYANTHKQAVTGAIEKLTTSLDTILGRLRNN